MTKDVSRWSEDARDQRSWEMNKNNPQFYKSRHIDIESERDAGILAVAGFCRTHFEANESEVEVLERFSLRKEWDARHPDPHALETPPDLAFMWDGREWIEQADHSSLDEYNYLLFCPKCGYIHSENFSWRAYPLNPSDAEYETILDKLATKLDLTLWGLEGVAEWGMTWVSSNAKATECASCGHEFVADEKRFWFRDSGRLLPHCEQCKGRMPP